MRCVFSEGQWHKRCGCCGDVFSAKRETGLLEFFFRDSAKVDGMQVRCKSCRIEINRKTLKTTAWRMKFEPIKYKARQKVRMAISRGKIKRLPCLVCGKAPAQAHHPDYEKPLDVIFLCSRHHREEHERMKK